MRCWWAMVCVGVVACSPVPPSSDLVAKSPPVSGFSFEEEDRSDEPPSTDVALTPEEQMRGQGLDPEALADVSAVVTPVLPATSGLPGAVAVTPAPALAPVTPMVPSPWPPPVAASLTWGVRLVSTVHDAQPPRAILGFANGKEAVVQPGTLLEEAGIAVLAIGRDQVQIAQFTPEGDHARVETTLLTALYPGRPLNP